MHALAADGSFALSNAEASALRRDFEAGTLDEPGTIEVIARLKRETGQVIDPHTAVGIGVAEKIGPDPRTPVVALATAHPAKFPDAVGRALGGTPVAPDRLRHVLEAEERFDVLPNDVRAVAALIKSRSRAAGGRT
jgi:threonine synthase